jgi:Ca2+-binding RTX toxin-like protein
VTLTMAPAPLTDVFYSGDPFNGPVFTVLSGNSFGSVTSLVVNNPDCVPCNSITAYVSGNSLFINWEGAGGEVGDAITINFAPGPPVPVMLDAVSAKHHLTTLSGTAEANSNVSVFDGTNLVGTVPAASDGTWTLQANLTGNGIHSFTESSTDLVGNTASSAGATLYSTSTNKSLVAGGGADVLIGAPGDTLTGGAGADTFVFNPKFGFDHSQFANATASQVLSQTHDSKAGAVIVVDAHDTITLTGVTVAQLQSHLSDFHFF